MGIKRVGTLKRTKVALRPRRGLGLKTAFRKRVSRKRAVKPSFAKAVGIIFNAWLLKCALIWDYMLQDLSFVSFNIKAKRAHKLIKSPKGQ